jgi:alanyl-tRNA synthetase
MQDMIYLATVLTQEKNTVAILASDAEGGKIVLAAHRSLHIDCSEIIKEASKILGGSGGGKKTLAQGGGPLSGSVTEVIRFCKKGVKEAMVKNIGDKKTTKISSKKSDENKK